ncbi:hypothetical protein Nmel_013374 [Mimus melanotis]
MTPIEWECGFTGGWEGSAEGPRQAGSMDQGHLYEGQQSLGWDRALWPQ